MLKRWNIKRHDREKVAQLANSIDVPPIIAALLIDRGHDSPESALRFLNPQLSDLHDPYLLKDMKKAVERIFRAIEQNQKILVWGDYDVDGTTGTVVLRKALEILGAESGFHIPDRFTEGYGLSVEKLAEAKDKGYQLVISVDTGSRAFEAAEWARENGVDLIITDHHPADEEKGSPDAFAVVNPNQPGCDYPDKNLAGVGVAFKLVHALLRERGREGLAASFLKMVAIGTIADIMNLSGENRAIVSLGLKDLPNAKNHGLRALMEVADCRAEMTSFDIGFRIAPRINAAGRMAAARRIVELFEAENFDQAREIAENLNKLNIERQTVQRRIFDLALQEYLGDGGGRDNQKYVAVISGENWHRGVIGLASSKITEKFYRPSLVISVENGIGHGSARSIADYHLLDALSSCADLFEKFGGHRAACGFTIKSENIPTLRDKLNQHAAENIEDTHLTPELSIDAAIASSSLNLELVGQLKKLEPYGMGNPRPIFVTKNFQLAHEPLVMKEKHLKMRLADDSNKMFEAVWWDGVDKLNGQTLRIGQRIELAYSPESNTWNGNTRLQLKVEDLKTVN